ncbi:hypothetical protein VKT23_008137 [Stygiomarasmius scandens]|uniref:DUF6532 domain-containing protein n=1 Tax=Marasmiellus scandens TaxID=2682957 RepID=A0ABR1JI99_9AGAR
MKTSKKSIHANKNRQDEDSQEEDENDTDEDDDREEDINASKSLSEKAPTIINSGRKKGTVAASQLHDSDLSADEDEEEDNSDDDSDGEENLQGDLTSIPATSDGELDWNKVAKPQKPKKTMTRVAKKLVEELPTVKRSSKTIRAPVVDYSDNQDKDKDTEDKEEWLLHTNIVLKPFTDATRTFKLALSGQNPKIKAVIKQACKKGTLQMVIDDTYCPLNEELKYTAPLTRYVTQRITIERRALKTGFAATVLSSLGIDSSPKGVSTALELVLNADYIYPLSGDAYDYLKPFGHKVIPEFMAAAFFSSNKLSKALKVQKTEIFMSSIPEKPLELEVPKAMVAMAASVVHAILQDHAHSADDNFPPPGLATQWYTFIEILDTLEAKSLMAYHRLMHDLYLKASHTIAPATHGLTRSDIISRIKWDEIAAEENTISAQTAAEGSGKAGGTSSNAEGEGE